MFPPLVIPALSYSFPVGLSIPQTPAVLPHSRKRPVSPGAEHVPGPPHHDILIAFNYKEGETRLDFSDIESSDLKSVGEPKIDRFR